MFDYDSMCASYSLAYFSVNVVSVVDTARNDQNKPSLMVIFLVLGFLLCLRRTEADVIFLSNIRSCYTTKHELKGRGYLLPMRDFALPTDTFTINAFVRYVSRAGKLLWLSSLQGVIKVDHTCNA